MPPTTDDLEGNDTMSPPPETDSGDADESMGENVICVPTDALSVPDEGDKMTPPEVGDKVQANIEGEVVSIKGEDAYVKLHAVNGQEVQDDEEHEPSEDDQDAAEESDLQQQAAQMPDNY